MGTFKNLFAPAITNPQDQQVLAYNGITKRWENITFSGGLTRNDIFDNGTNLNAQSVGYGSNVNKIKGNNNFRYDDTAGQLSINGGSAAVKINGATYQESQISHPSTTTYSVAGTLNLVANQINLNNQTTLPILTPNINGSLSRSSGTPSNLQYFNGTLVQNISSVSAGAGSQNRIARQNSTGTGLIYSSNFIFDETGVPTLKIGTFDIVKNGNFAQLFALGANDRLQLRSTAETTILYATSSSSFRATPTLTELGNVSDPNHSVRLSAVLRLAVNPIQPTTTDGYIWYDATSGQTKIRANGKTVNLSQPTGFLPPAAVTLTGSYPTDRPAIQLYLDNYRQFLLNANY